MQLNSPAKLNLFFKALGKRSDGYHEVSTLCQTISLFDRITLRPSGGDTFSCTDPDVPLGTDNLILHALHLFRRVTGKLQPVSIHLEKNIPMKSGLGGSSSNAATILWGLNELLRKPLSLTQLKLLGRKIGADVSFFFSEGTAHCKGFGEQVENLEPLSKQSAYLAFPAFGLSTSDVYRNLDLRGVSSDSPEDLLSKWKKGIATCMNDLEMAAQTLNPEIARFKEQLQSMPFDHVSMTGSGSAFFCLGFSETPQNMKGVVTHFHNRKSATWY